MIPSICEMLLRDAKIGYCISISPSSAVRDAVNASLSAPRSKVSSRRPSPARVNAIRRPF